MVGAADRFRYDGKRAVVVGGASGIGAATVAALVDLGAEVVAMDVAPVQRDDVAVVQVDLTDKRSIERALDDCGGPIHALLSCAGVADGPKLPAVNFIGQRHLIERAVEGDLLPRGSRCRDGVLGRRPGVGGQPRSTAGVRVDTDVRGGGGMDSGTP